MSLWMGSAVVHELYTTASGLYVCWVSVRAATVLLSWMPQGRMVIMVKVQEWTLMVTPRLCRSRQQKPPASEIWIVFVWIVFGGGRSLRRWW